MININTLNDKHNLIINDNFIINLNYIQKRNNYILTYTNVNFYLYNNSFNPELINTSFKIIYNYLSNIIDTYDQNNLSIYLDNFYVYHKGIMYDLFRNIPNSTLNLIKSFHYLNRLEKPIIDEIDYHNVLLNLNNTPYNIHKLIHNTHNSLFIGNLSGINYELNNKFTYDIIFNNTPDDFNLNNLTINLYTNIIEPTNYNQTLINNIVKLYHNNYINLFISNF